MDIENPLVTQKAVNNPYFIAIREIQYRLSWDLNRESWRSRQKLKKALDQYKGKKAVILCNGPSLLDTNFDLIRETGVYTFGLNKINLLFDKRDFKPSCIVSVNPFVLEQNKEFFNKTEIQLFLASKAVKFINSRRNVVFLKNTSNRRFARDCSSSIYEGATVTFVALQLAFHMGFEKVALVGCDHNFATKGPANAVVTSGDKDPNHFDPNYFAGGQKWELPDLFESEVAYQMAQNTYSSFDRKIVNCTSGGKLDIFPRETLEEFLK